MENKKWKTKDVCLFVLYSLFGIFMFFVPIQIGKNNTIPIDHIVNAIKSIPNYGIIFGTFMVLPVLLMQLKTRNGRAILFARYSLPLNWLPWYFW